MYGFCVWELLSSDRAGDLLVCPSVLDHPLSLLCHDPNNKVSEGRSVYHNNKKNETFSIRRVLYLGNATCVFWQAREDGLVTVDMGPPELNGPKVPTTLPPNADGVVLQAPIQV